MDGSGTWVVIGDSFSDVRHSGYIEHGVRTWPEIAAERLGVNVRNFASSGDGYVHRRACTFVEQADVAASAVSAGELDPESVSRVIVYGGINDYAMEADAEQVQLAAAEIGQVLVGAFPHARVEAFFNWYPHELDDLARAYVGAVSVGFSLAGVPLRTDSMWILENDEVKDAYLPDNLHPNQRGHGLMADFFCLKP